MIRQERVGDIGVGNIAWFSKDTGDGPATSASAIRKVLAIRKVFAIRKVLAIKKVLAIRKVLAMRKDLAIRKVLAIGKRPKVVVVDAGRRHGKVFPSGIARRSLRSIDVGCGARAVGATGISLPAA